MSLDQVPALLAALASPGSPQELAHNTALIQGLYTTPGFYNVLQQTALDRGAPRDARVLAGLVLKNEMISRWRGRTIVPDDEKQLIRERFFAFLAEPDSAIATTQFWILSKVSRVDYPRAWPDLAQRQLNALIASAQTHLSSDPSSSPAEPGLMNALVALNRLVKEWTTIKLPLGSKVLAEWAALLLPVLVPLLEELGRRPADTRLATWTAKTVGRLAVWDWSRLASSKDPDGPARAHLVFGLVVGQLGAKVAERSALLGAMRASEEARGEDARRRLAELTAFVKGALKYLRRMQEANPSEFAGLPRGSAVVLHLWSLTRTHLTGDFHGEDQEAAEWPNAFKITTLLLIKDLLPAWQSKHPDVMTPAFIADLFETLVDGALLLSEADLEELDDDAEEWCVRESSSNEQWTFELRPCGERVLLALNIACRNREDQIMQVLMQNKLSDAMSTPITDAASLRRKEAVYTAAGRLVRFVVQNERIPAPVLLGVLRDECLQQGPEWRPLKRRIGWLIGELVEADDELAASDLPWQPLLFLVTDRSASSDPGVRLTAASALKVCMDLWELDPAVFSPYIPRIADGLMNLLDELQTLEGKRRVLGAVEVMSEREGLDIKPYVGGIAAKVPELWGKAASIEGEWLFKASLLTMVTKLVEALGSQAHEITPLCIHLLGESLTGSAKLHLDEDALVLWQSLLRTAHALDPQLAALVPAAVEQLATDRDQLNRALDVLDSYVLLDGARVFESYANPICQVLGDVLATSQPSVIIDLLTSISLHIQVVPFETWATAAISTGLIKRLFEGAVDPKVGTALPQYASALARIVLASPPSFFPLLAQAGVPPQAFLDLWWDAFDRLSLSSMRKRVALASAALCATGERAVLERFGELLNIFLDVLGELKETEEDTAGDLSKTSSLNLHWKRGVDAPVAGDAEGTAEGERLKQLHDRDPVYSASLKGFLRTNLAQTANLASFVDPADPAFVELQGYLGS